MIWRHEIQGAQGLHVASAADSHHSVALYSLVPKRVSEPCSKFASPKETPHWMDSALRDKDEQFCEAE